MKATKGYRIPQNTSCIELKEHLTPGHSYKLYFLVQLYIYICVCVLLCPSMIMSAHCCFKKVIRWSVSLSAHKPMHQNNPVPSMSTGKKLATFMTFPSTVTCFVFHVKYYSKCFN